MVVVVLLSVVAVLLGINIFLWKSGFLFDAERPKTVVDKPVTDPKVRKAALKRIQRWKEEGRITREEHERWTRLCDEEWD